MLDQDKPVLFVEYDGEQHFRPVRFGNISEKKAVQKFRTQKRLDKRKSRLIKKYYTCTPFIRFNYRENISEEYVVEKLIKCDAIKNGTFVNKT